MYKLNSVRINNFDGRLVVVECESYQGRKKFMVFEDKAKNKNYIDAVCIAFIPENRVEIELDHPDPVCWSEVHYLSIFLFFVII